MSGGYCIPFNRVCDGYRDCELGEDEDNCGRRIDLCRGKFLCVRTRHCISQANICDGFFGCAPNSHQQSEDEMFCDVVCPPGCLCIGFGIMCRAIGLTAIPAVTTQTKAFILPDNNLVIEAYDLYDYELLLKVDFSGNGLSSLNFFLHMHSYDMIEIVLARNSLSSIPSRIFYPFKNLAKLDLQGNPLAFIEPHAFTNLRRLPALHLDNMVINSVAAFSENLLYELEFLNLSYNYLEYIGADTFNNLELLKSLDLRGQICSPQNTSFAVPPKKMPRRVTLSQTSSRPAMILCVALVCASAFGCLA